MTAPRPDTEALRARYDAVLADVEPPFAFVDLDALRANAAQMLGAGRRRCRSGSPRSRCARCRCCGGSSRLDERFRGILSFTLPEALDAGRRGLRRHLRRLSERRSRARSRSSRRSPPQRPDAHPALIVDEPAQLDLIESAARAGRRHSAGRDRHRPELVARAAGALARIGPKRSPIRTAEQARRLAEEIERRPGTRLVGAMAYEGHIAGVGDRIPGRPVRSAAIRLMQARSEAELAPAPAGGDRRDPRGRGARVGELRRHRQPLAERRSWASRPSSPPARASTRRRCSTTTARSTSRRRRCSACRSRAAPVPAWRRRSAAATSPRERRAPTGSPAPYLPAGLTARPRRGRRRGADAARRARPRRSSAIGDRVYMRHAKAGELCERFDSLYLVEGDSDRGRGARPTGAAGHASLALSSAFVARHGGPRLGSPRDGRG